MEIKLELLRIVPIIEASHFLHLARQSFSATSDQLGTATIGGVGISDSNDNYTIIVHQDTYCATFIVEEYCGDLLLEYLIFLSFPSRDAEDKRRFT